MKIAIYTNKISPHLLPLARELARVVGEKEIVYVYTERMSNERLKLGWEGESKEKWVRCFSESPEELWDNLETCELLLCGERDIGLMETREHAGRTTLYISERWLKPMSIGFERSTIDPSWGIRLPGIVRIFSPRYFLMARKFVKLLKGSRHLIFLPAGIWAARDMARLVGLLGGFSGWRFRRAPELDFEGRPGGKIWVCGKENDKELLREYCLDKMRMWGYFVEPSKFRTTREKAIEAVPSKYLWVGRLVWWKRLDAVVKAFANNPERCLDIYGDGPELNRLKRLVGKLGANVRMHSPVPIAEVRKVMREHDVYILASNMCEGWGAVLNEALEEGMSVIGTFEAGSSATILPEKNLFHSGDVDGLSALIQKGVARYTEDKWSVGNAALAVLEHWVQ